MKKDKKWLIEEINNLYEDYIRSDWNSAVGACEELVDQLDEPQKVTVPKWFDEWVKKNIIPERRTYSRLCELFSDELAMELTLEQNDWIESHIEEAIRSILDGFTIANEDEELWKPIENYEGLYEVSNKGNVRSLDRDVQYKKTDFTMNIKGVDLKPNVLKKGYLQVGLSKNGKIKSMLVHRLVMNAFNPTTDESLQINHIDGNKENNEVSNLEWVTAIENTNHAYDIGLRDDTIGNNRKLTEDEVLEIIDLYETGNYTQKELGNKYNVGRNAIGEILLGKTWGWLTGITREVEEEKEKLYWVLDKDGSTMITKEYPDKRVIFRAGWCYPSEIRSDLKEYYQFTEQEIKAYDERYIPFMVPVEEVDNE